MTVAELDARCKPKLTHCNSPLLQKGFEIDTSELSSRLSVDIYTSLDILFTGHSRSARVSEAVGRPPLSLYWKQFSAYHPRGLKNVAQFCLNVHTLKVELLHHHHHHHHHPGFAGLFLAHFPRVLQWVLGTNTCKNLPCLLVVNLVKAGETVSPATDQLEIRAIGYQCKPKVEQATWKGDIFML
eukprot:1161432-Pelagomonas_calceolata.AAC.1